MSATEMMSENEEVCRDEQHEEPEEDDDDEADGQVDALMRELYQDAEATHAWAEFQMNQEADVKVEPDPWEIKEADQGQDEDDSDRAYQEEMSNTWGSMLRKREQFNDGPSDGFLGFLSSKQTSSSKNVMSTAVRSSGNQWNQACSIAQAAEPIVEVLTSGGDTKDMHYMIHEAIEATGMQRVLGTANKAQRGAFTCALRMISLGGILFMLAIATSSPDSTELAAIEKLQAMDQAEPAEGTKEFEEAAGKEFKKEMARQEALSRAAMSNQWNMVGSKLLAHQGVSQRLCQDKYSDKCPAWAKAGDCEKNPKGMRSICKLSCGVCEEPENHCHDQFADCVFWADSGECKKNPIGMNDFCKQSCGGCAIGDKPKAVKTLTPAELEDKREDAEDAAMDTEEKKLASMREEIHKKERAVEKTVAAAVRDAAQGKVTEAAEAMMVKKMLEKEKENDIIAYQKEEATAHGSHNLNLQDADDEPNEEEHASNQPMTKEEEAVFKQAAALERQAAHEKAEKAMGKVKQLPDSHAECGNWAQLGECSKNIEWMMSNCARSCVGHMLGAPTGPTEGLDGSVDVHEECGTWAASGECKKNEEWMKSNCVKSCSEAAAAAPSISNPEPESVHAYTIGRKIMDEGHTAQDNSVVRGRLKSVKHDQSHIQQAATSSIRSPEHQKDMHGFKERMQTSHTAAAKGATAYTVEKDKVKQGHFKNNHEMEQSARQKANQQKQAAAKKDAKTFSIMRPKPKA